MKSGVLANCHRCGYSVDSFERQDGLCATCRATEAAEPHLVEFSRLWRKHLRYSSRGVGQQQALRNQAGRVAQRVQKAISDRIGNPRLAEQLTTELLDRAVQEAESVTGRIHIAHAGDLVEA